jgi:hypothetical protein
VETFLITAAIFDGHEESVGRVRAPRSGTVAYSLVATLILGLGRGMWHIPLYGPLGFLVPSMLPTHSPLNWDLRTWLHLRGRETLSEDAQRLPDRSVTASSCGWEFGVVRFGADRWTA